MILETIAVAVALSLVLGAVRGARRDVELRECRCWMPSGSGERCSCCYGLVFTRGRR